MRDQEKCPKILISCRRGGLFKHQNNSFFDLERHHLGCGARVAIAPFFSVPQPTSAFPAPKIPQNFVCELSYSRADIEPCPESNVPAVCPHLI
jgi:hypothetical protein